MCYISIYKYITATYVSHATFTFRVDEELKAEFALAAKSMDRSGAQLLRDYMREIVRREREAEDYDAWFREQVAAGLRSVREGKVISNEEAESRFAKRRDTLRRKLNESA